MYMYNDVYTNWFRERERERERREREKEREREAILKGR